MVSRTPFDQDLSHDHGDQDAGGFADPAHLIPIDAVESGVDFAEDFGVTLLELACLGLQVDAPIGGRLSDHLLRLSFDFGGLRHGGWK